jgi:hypothetical protein
VKGRNEWVNRRSWEVVWPGIVLRQILVVVSGKVKRCSSILSI